MLRSMGSSGLVLAAVMLLPRPVGAQTSASGDWTREARAEQLSARARSLFEQPGQYRLAARMLRQAARMRAVDDPAAVEDLILSARLYHYAGDAGAARQSMESAGARALEAGDLLQAANAFVDAAFLAIEQRKWNIVDALSSRAERLARSQYLSHTDRTAVLKRLDPAKLALANAGR